MKFDTVIVGGGIIGSSIAYHLLREPGSGTVGVIEPDPTYEIAAAPRSAGGIRRLFRLPENIRMSQYGHQFYLDFPETMAVDGEPSAIDFRQQGYLFLAGAQDADVLEESIVLQVSLGVDVDRLDGAGVKDRFPSLEVDDVVLAAHASGDGWIDPYSAVRGFRRKAVELGATYIEDRVIGFDRDDTAVRAARLQSGESVSGDMFVIAPGAWIGEVAAMAGMGLPIDAMPRLMHYFVTRETLEPLPLVKDISALGFRPEGAGYVGGFAEWGVPGGIDYSIDHGYFERRVWPALMARVPAFESVKAERTWACHYARNRLDHNAVIGPWLGGCENFLVAGGFSGHGVMHAPATGRAVSELVLHGEYRTLDLSRFSYQRIIDNEPYAEGGIL